MQYCEGCIVLRRMSITIGDTISTEWYTIHNCSGCPVFGGMLLVCGGCSVLGTSVQYCEGCIVLRRMFITVGDTISTGEIPL